MSTLLTTSLLITGAVIERDDDNPAATRRYVYQRVASGMGHRRYSASRDIQRRRWVQTPHANTTLQLLHKARMAAAVAAWHALDADQRKAYKRPANAKAITPFNAFISAYAKANPITYTPPAYIDITTTAAEVFTLSANGKPYAEPSTTEARLTITT